MKAAFTPGTTFAGYRVDSLVGRGGMGVVYRATDLSLQRPVALKLIAPELAEDERSRVRFLRESRLAASLDHPNVIPVHEAGEHDGQLYLAMRFVEGRDLKSVLERERTLTPERTLRVVDQVAGALDAAHRRALVHRDVKPTNVLMDEGGHVYLTDFGITKQAGGESTDTGRVVGTVDYLAPEQIRGDPVDGRTDVYALGCVLYECLAGAPPFRRATEAETLWAHMQEEPAPPKGHAALDPVLRKALAKDREDRYRTCAELVEAAAAALVLNAPSAARRPLVPPGLRQRAHLLVAAGLILLAGVIALAIVTLSGDGGSGAEPLGNPVAAAIDPVDSPIDASQLKRMPFGTRSHWLQPWRAYLDTPPAQQLRDAVGINFNVNADQAAAAARLLAANGFHRARIEISWGEVDYDNPDRLYRPPEWRTRLEALRAAGLRPLLLLNSNPGRPAPAKALPLTVAIPAAAGARTVQLSAASANAIVPGRTGFDVADMAAGVLITSVSASGTATLSRPLPSALSAGMYPGTVLRYEPFSPLENPDGSPSSRGLETMAGWLEYVRTATSFVKDVLGSTEFDVEVTNETTFGAAFYDINQYYSPALTKQRLDLHVDSGYPQIYDMAKAVNAQIRALAPVLNSPTVTSGHSLSSATTRRMVKWYAGKGKFYVFLGTQNGGNATFNRRCVGSATATRLAPSNLPGKAASIPVSNGSFTDSLATKDAVHIYRIDGGSTCGL
jgi:serine/threonine protein kinase